jgi:hypothetical protein
MASKAGFPLSHVDATNKLTRDAKKIFGLLRRRQTGITPIITGSGAGQGFGSSGGTPPSGITGGPGKFLVKQITPQVHDHDTSDGIPVGWCPDGSRTQFVIIDSDVGAKSVVASNISSSHAGGNFGDKSVIKVRLINYAAGNDRGFLIQCETAPVSDANLNYAIFNNSSINSTNSPSNVMSSNSTDCQGYATGFINAQRLGQSALTPGGIIISIGVKGCADGGHFRLKVYSSTASPTAQPSSLIGQTDSLPLKTGWNDVNVSIVIPADPSNAPFGVVYVGVEFDSTVSVDQDSGLAQLWSGVHVYGPDGPATFAFNPANAPALRLSWVEVI